MSRPSVTRAARGAMPGGPRRFEVPANLPRSGAAEALRWDANSPDERHEARLTVATFALDVEDLSDLLDKLALFPDVDLDR